VKILFNLKINIYSLLRELGGLFHMVLYIFLIHAGKKKVKDMHVYLEPVIDELKRLWVTGVEA
jgi:hypothetical protein